MNLPGTLGGRELNIFYKEPDPDRWLPLDRYPRAALRRIARGPSRPGGQTRVFLNLCAGLDRIGVPYSVNDFAYARRNPNALACIIGKPFVLDLVEWQNPILFGAAVYSHPIDDPELFTRRPVKNVLVPGEWMRRMCEPYWGGRVQAWPVGIDTDTWQPSDAAQKDTDILLYDKIRWDHDLFEETLIGPIRRVLRTSGVSFREIRYGHYREEEFQRELARCKAMVFLCEHETQGIAYQQALAAGVPIFAWDRGGFWQDPSYYPERVKFGPVSSVPYWDERCGMTFADIAAFERQWEEFWKSASAGYYAPRDYVVENLTLEKCARKYAAIAESLCS